MHRLVAAALLRAARLPLCRRCVRWCWRWFRVAGTLVHLTLLNPRTNKTYEITAQRHVSISRSHVTSSPLPGAARTAAGGSAPPSRPVTVRCNCRAGTSVGVCLLVSASWK